MSDFRTIPLTRGYEAVVDPADYDSVSALKWRVHTLRGLAYAIRSLPGDKTISLHRFLLAPPAGYVVDHINGNGLDNRRSNIRVCTQAENAINRSKNRNGSSPFKGVYWHKAKSIWEARIQCRGKVTFLGGFADPAVAAAAYDEAAKRLHGEFCNLNFPAEAA